MHKLHKLQIEVYDDFSSMKMIGCGPLVHLKMVIGPCVIVDPPGTSKTLKIIKYKKNVFHSN